MEQEHPIPQQISAYQFRLVGDMTIKQFFQVAAGSLIAILLYSSGLPAIVKWPFIILSFLTGIAFAFVSLQDRPLPKWIFLFLKSIYSPTLFTWQKGATQPQYFQPEDAQKFATSTTQTQKPELVETAKPGTEESQKLEKKEQEFLQKVSKHFKNDMSDMPADHLTQQSQPAKALPQIKVEKERKVNVVKSTPVQVERKIKEPKIDYLQSQAPETSTGTQVSPLSQSKPVGTQAATFSDEAAPPIPPTKPNIIVGQVIDSDGNIVESAILEIKDSEGRSARALKSNKLGHFMIVTPLLDGKYEIITEKEGFKFNPISFEAKGEIIPSIVIRSQ